MRLTLLSVYTGPSSPVSSSACGGAGAGVGLRAWATARLRGALRSWRPPAVGVDRLTIRGGLLEARVMGEAQPRRMQDVAMTLRLGADYRALTLDVAGAPGSALAARCGFRGQAHAQHVGQGTCLWL